MSILVTGNTGFVGQRLIKTLLKIGYEIVGIGRRPANILAIDNYSYHSINDFSAISNWQKVLEGVEVVIHTIARVHIMGEEEANSIDLYRACNTNATLNLAKQAAEAGVKRFIFLSSIKVNGESTEFSMPFTEQDLYTPTDPYGLSKYEAEQGLLEIAEQTAMEVVIIRPPLVYGPGVKANFANMLGIVKKGLPLPLGAVKNKRSLIALDNLVDFITLCITHPKAANETFLISDGEDVSTTELLRKVAKAFNKNQCLLPLPVSWMTWAATLIGKKTVADRLFGSLQVDNSKARNLLGWKPIVTMDEQLAKMVQAEKK